MEITLDDLLILEPRLVWAAAECDERGLGRRGSAEVSWVVSARTTSPHLPLLRGGEVVLIPPRVTATVGADLPALMREANHRDVVALVFERGAFDCHTTYPESNAMSALLWDGILSSEVETEINRQLTECRGNLYRVGTELERQMTDLTAGQSGMGDLIQIASELSGLPMRVIDAQGRQIAGSHLDELVHEEEAPAAHDSRFERELPSGMTLVVGPLHPRQRVMGRFLVDRIAGAASVAARRDDAARPRGARRIEAVAALLRRQHATASEQRAAAIDLGLDPDAMFFVAVSSGGSDSALMKALAPLGSNHAAGTARGRRTTLIAANGRASADSVAGRVAEIKQRWEDETGHGEATLALSAPSLGVARVPVAALEAGFVASIQAQPQFTRRAASFDSIEDVGAFRLLFQLRDSVELRQFVSDALGTLERRDQRGALRKTLRAFLECGGSHVAASNQLGIHRNTLAYRLRRIGELVGRDVADPETWLTLHIALWASEMLRVFADEG